VRAVGAIRGIESHVKINGRPTSKANGQECPFHTGNVNVKANAAGVRNSHLSQKTRKMGHPLLMRVQSGCGAGRGISWRIEEKIFHIYLKIAHSESYTVATVPPAFQSSSV
jgi:hypothetical protein